MYNIFPLHATDFYKTGHYAQYPKNTQMVYSNLTCRSDKWFRGLPDFDHKVVFFGLQAFCQWMLIDQWNKEFFHRPKSEVVSRYKRRMDKALGPDLVDTKHIEDLHDLGYLPIWIKAIKEGSRVNIRVPVLTIVNTHEKFGWLTNYLETQLSAELHKPITTATMAHEYRRLLDSYAELTGSSKEFVPWQGHDFSCRGMSGIWDATINGAAHLLSFTGTDTVSALDFLEDYYVASKTFIGGSVPATEHSVMCMGGQETEIETFKRLITDVYPKGIVSIVSDTWDFWKVMTDYAYQLKYVIKNREGKVVFRPDSGDPVDIICGTGEDTPEGKGAVECLWEIFGGTITEKGYKLLDSHVGLIYGDSITLERAQAILKGLEAKGFASGNIVFGIGSYTYNYCTRDTLGSAIKATWGMVDGKPQDLFKAPKTDNGVKNSACGLVRVEKVGDDFVLHDKQPLDAGGEIGGELETVFIDGKMARVQTLEEIRSLLNG